MTNSALMDKIRSLPVWKGPIDISPLGGGRTNLNFVITDSEKRYVLRVGEDIPFHHVMRFNELAASRAAHAAGLSPAVVYSGNGMMVIDYIDARTLTEADVCMPEYLERIIPLIRSCHHDVSKQFRGASLIFWVFHVIRDYAATLADHNSPYTARLPQLLQINARLEAAAGPFDIVFGHNDLLATNIMDDGIRLWLIDWDYAGFNSPLFDLGGLASNSGLDENAERWMLETYFSKPPTNAVLHQYYAMKCASLLRETMWSMVSELTSNLDVDYPAYTVDFLGRFERTYNTYLQS